MWLHEFQLKTNNNFLKTYLFFYIFDAFTQRKSQIGNDERFKSMHNNIYVGHKGIEIVYYVNVKTLKFARGFYALQKQTYILNDKYAKRWIKSDVNQILLHLLF